MPWLPPAGGTAEHELERLAVQRAPLGDDVGDEAPVVVGGQHERALGGPAQAERGWAPA